MEHLHCEQRHRQAHPAARGSGAEGGQEGHSFPAEGRAVVHILWRAAEEEGKQRWLRGAPRQALRILARHCQGHPAHLPPPSLLPPRRQRAHARARPRRLLQPQPRHRLLPEHELHRRHAAPLHARGPRLLGPRHHRRGPPPGVLLRVDDRHAGGPEGAGGAAAGEDAAAGGALPQARPADGGGDDQVVHVPLRGHAPDGDDAARVGLLLLPGQPHHHQRGARHPEGARGGAAEGGLL
mmetsp:Transcript_9234/g.37985  ORF Transcript_9234/g.37985 Transcript_9234/m.37985 type:complete len:238 (-) Transcript_9234:902-1615(-)